MDWYAWLCRAGLHPDVAFEYALLFARNELGAADVRHLDHEFLLSMGVAVAKHRLEILKLARKDPSSSHGRATAVAAAAEAEADAGAREQLVQVVPFQDEEADGDEVELGVEERGRGEAAAAPERERADVRVAPHGRGRVHAPLQEQARVAARRRDDEQQRQAQPPALRQRVRDGQQPDA